MRLVVGLGNPGPRYSQTRHNLGFMVVDRLAAGQAVGFRTAHQALVGRLVLPSPGGKNAGLYLLKPLTFMNLSGQAVGAALRYFRLTPADLVVIHDDLDLELGRVRLRSIGSAGGHRGVDSIIGVLGTQQFYRIRLGIGRPPDGVSPAEFVLQPFAPEEQEKVEGMIAMAADAVRLAAWEGWEAAARRHSG